MKPDWKETLALVGLLVLVVIATLITGYFVGGSLFLIFLAYLACGIGGLVVGFFL